MRNVICLAVLVSSAVPVPAQTGARTALITANTTLSSSVFTNGIAATLPAALGAEGVVVWPGAGVVQGSTAATQFFRRQLQLASNETVWTEGIGTGRAPDATVIRPSGGIHRRRFDIRWRCWGDWCRSCVCEVGRAGRDDIRVNW